MGRVSQSIVWLLGTGALGYTLLLVTSPNEKIIAQKYSEPSGPSSEALRKKQAILDTIRLAAENKNPLYRQTKDKIEEQLKQK